MKGEIEHKQNSQKTKNVSSLLNMDIQLLQDLIGAKKLRICELMCGTGRMTIPLALDGHSITGIEIQESFADIARDKLEKSGGHADIQVADARNPSWGSDYDLIIIGHDALQELGSPIEQERIISTSFTSLKEEGHIFIDNANNEDVSKLYPPTLECEGVDQQSSSLCFKTEDIRLNKKRKRLSYRYSLYRHTKQGRERIQSENRNSYLVSGSEIQYWLTRTGFEIIHKYCDYEGRPYHKGADRVVFWAKKPKQTREA